MSVISNAYTGDGVTDLFSLSFPYIDFADVNVTVNEVPLTILTEWIFTTGSTIQILTVPAVGDKIFIYRKTSDDFLKSSFFPGSAIRAKDLNDNFNQGLYIAQESESASSIAGDEAKEAAESAAAAQAAAEQAQESADSAAEDAQEASDLASVANINASNALSVAQEAKSDAAEAVIKSDQALSAVLEVIEYEVVQTVAEIPTSPSDSEGVKVVNSTGIESFTPLTGLPVGFVGDPGIFVQIIYSATANSWVYSAYNANDPDDRYSGGLDALSKSGGTMTGDIIFSDSQDFPNVNSLPSLP